MNILWSKKMRRLSQELDQAVIWNDKNEISPISLTHSKTFALRLTTLFNHHLINEDLSNYQMNYGLDIYNLASTISLILDSDDISDSSVNDLCEIFFG